MFKLKYITIIIVFFMIIIAFNISYNNNLFRLHVVGNSNSVEDKIVKLKISSKINDYIYKVIDSNINKEKLYEILKSKSNEILDICNEELRKNNKNYLATVNIGKIYYDKKDNIYSSMNEGIYDSIRIVLGEGKGENFFDILLPNKKNIKKLRNLESIIPGIASIYEDTNVSYEFKFDLFKNIAKKLNIE
jgi:stage II sporulation protein R